MQREVDFVLIVPCSGRVARKWFRLYEKQKGAFNSPSEFLDRLLFDVDADYNVETLPTNPLGLLSKREPMVLSSDHVFTHTLQARLNLDKDVIDLILTNEDLPHHPSSISNHKNGNQFHTVSESDHERIDLNQLGVRFINDVDPSVVREFQVITRELSDPSQLDLEVSALAELNEKCCEVKRSPKIKVKRKQKSKANSGKDLKKDKSMFAFVCPLCYNNNRFVSKDKVLHHVNKFHVMRTQPDGEGAFFCAICSEMVDCVEHITSHLVRLQFSRCRKCRQRYVTEEGHEHCRSNPACIKNKTLRRIRRYKKDGQIVYHCFSCRKRDNFVSHRFEDMKEHFQTCIGNVGKPKFKYTITGLKKEFLCDICGKASKEAKHHREHMAMHARVMAGHTVECSFCGNRYATESSLKIHVRRVHLKQRDQTCHLCGKTFADRTALKKHSYVHSGEKSFKCTYCPKQFSGKYNFQQHLNIHTGTKAYKCEYCEMTFTQRAGYCQHLRKHTGIKVSDKFKLQVELKAKENGGVQSDTKPEVFQTF